MQSKLLKTMDSQDLKPQMDVFLGRKIIFKFHWKNFREKQRCLFNYGKQFNNRSIPILTAVRFVALIKEKTLHYLATLYSTLWFCENKAEKQMDRLTILYDANTDSYQLHMCVIWKL